MLTSQAYSVAWIRTFIYGDDRNWAWNFVLLLEEDYMIFKSPFQLNYSILCGGNCCSAAVEPAPQLKHEVPSQQGERLG